MADLGRGCLIAFEGPDGLGKSTQLERLREWLTARGFPAETVREPGGTSLGEQLRMLLLTAEVEPTPLAEALLFAAARAELVAKVVRPHLEAGRVVLMDRYVESSVAYQGYGAEVGSDTVLAINRIATGGLMPTVTLLFSGQGFSKGPKDRIERRSEAFRERVREGYARLAAEFPHIQIVEADHPPDEVAARIRMIVEPHLEPKGEARG